MDAAKPEAKETVAEVACPPSVPDALWALVPADRRREFLEAAAMNLRRAVHPEHTVTEMLLAIGISPEPAAPGAPFALSSAMSRFRPPARD